MIQFKCKRCLKTLNAPPSQVGKVGKCPHCGRENIVPTPQEAKSTPLARSTPASTDTIDSWLDAGQGADDIIKSLSQPSSRLASRGAAASAGAKKKTIVASPVDKFMLAAIEEAKIGLKEGGIPIGSVLVRNGKIIGRGHNRRVQNGDPMAHAEIECLRNAGRIGRYDDTTLYSTLMPCYLCAGAVVQFKIPMVIVGESKTFEGARDFMETHGATVVDLDLAECKTMMKKFIAANPKLWNEDIACK